MRFVDNKLVWSAPKTKIWKNLPTDGKFHDTICNFLGQDTKQSEIPSYYNTSVPAIDRLHQSTVSDILLLEEEAHTRWRGVRLGCERLEAVK